MRIMLLHLLCACLSLLALGGCALDWHHSSVAQQDAGETAQEPVVREDADPEADVDADADADTVASLGPLGSDVERSGPEAGSPDCGAQDCDEPSRCAGGGCSDAAACEGAACQREASCEDGQVIDGGVCTAPLDACQRSPAPCAADEVCELADGQAHCSCARGLTSCGGECVDTRKERGHCGDCGYACAPGLSCEAGKCAQKVHELVLGDSDSCALLEPADAQGAYALKCWGSDAMGFFRSAPPEESPQEMDAGTPQVTNGIPRQIEGLPKVRSMALAKHRRCVVPPEGGSVRCWGVCGKDCGSDAARDVDYTAWYDFDSHAAQRLTTADGLDGFLDLGGETCVLSAAGELACAGYAIFVTSSMDRSLPFPVRVDATANTPKVRDLASSTFHSCAVLDEELGRVACWGRAASRTLGAQSRCPAVEQQPFFATCKDDETVAVYVAKAEGGNLTKASSVRVSDLLSCAVSEDGVYCWGDNALGLLGCGDTMPHTGAVRVVDLPADIEQVAVGGSFACARAQSGQVWCWGVRGSLGIGDDAQGDASDGNYFSRPQPLPGLRDALDVWAGNGHACARRRSGEVVCWGSNEDGQLGTADELPHTTPTAVKNLF